MIRRKSANNLLLWIGCAAAGLATAGRLAHAEAPPLTADAIREAVAGATVHIDAPMGSVLPVTFNEDGGLTGQAGRLGYFLGAASDRGRWWVVNEKLCFKWSKWFDAETSCMQVRRNGSRVTWRRDDGKTGSATIVARNEPATAVAMVAGQPASTLGGPLPQAPATRWTSETKPAETKPADARPAATPATAPAEAARATPAVKRPQPAAAAPPAATAAAAAPYRTAAAAPPPAPAPQEMAATPPRPAASTPTLSAISYRVVYVRSDDVLNIRNAPSAEAAIVGEIPYHAVGVRMTGPCHGDWCAILFKATTGWVNRLYLSPELPGSARERNTQNNEPLIKERG